MSDPKFLAGSEKPQLGLVPMVALEQEAGALSLGAKKYGLWNWRDGDIEMMTYLHAILRHTHKVIQGEDIDPESGFHHLGHIRAGAGIVLDAREFGTLVDNRPRRRGIIEHG